MSHLGLLSEVSDLQIGLNFNCSSNGDITIQWMPPFTLDLSQIQYDIWYNLEVIYDSKYVLTQEMVTTTTFMSLLSDLNANNLTCGSFEVTITPYNIVGFGISTKIIENPLNKGK